MAKEKKHGNNNGLTVAIIILLVIISLGLAYAKKNNDKSTANTTSNTTNSVAIACDESGDKDFCKYVTTIKNMSNTSFVSELTTSNNSETTTSKISADGKGNSIIEGSGSTFIHLNSVSYVKNEDTWTKFPLGQDTPISEQIKDTGVLITDLGLNNSDVSQSNYRKIGEENCGSSDCLKYEITTTSSDQTVTTTVWFDKNDYKVRKIESNSPSNGKTVMTISYEEVVINEPSPVQELDTSSLNN